MKAPREEPIDRPRKSRPWHIGALDSAAAGIGNHSTAPRGPARSPDPGHSTPDPDGPDPKKLDYICSREVPTLSKNQRCEVSKWGGRLEAPAMGAKFGSEWISGINTVWFRGWTYDGKKYFTLQVMPGGETLPYYGNILTNQAGAKYILHRWFNDPVNRKYVE
jgi:hypothetical protein